MTATTDTHPQLGSQAEFDQPATLRDTLSSASGVNHAGRVFFGSALVLSAIGLWLIPVDAGDAAMQLIKLLVSLVMLILGGMFIFSARQRSEHPEIQIDTARREIRILKRDSSGQPVVEACHSIDSLSEVNMTNKLLTARDELGQLILSVPLQDKSTEAALRSALAI